MRKTCRSYGAQKSFEPPACYKHAVPTGLQTYRPDGTHNVIVDPGISTNMPSLRDFLAEPHIGDMFVERGSIKTIASRIAAICL